MNYLNDLEVSMEQYNRWYKNIKKSKAGYSFMVHILEDGTTHRRKVEIREDLGLRCKSIDGKSWHRLEVRQEEEELIECHDCGTMSQLFLKHQGVSMGGVVYDISIGKCCEKHY